MQTSFLLMRLAILLPLLSPRSCRGQTWAAFQNKHIDFPRSKAPNLNAYCNQMMVRRHLNPQVCKSHNTFINNATTTIQLVCGPGGTHFSRNLYDSKQYLVMVDCHGRGGTAPSDCRYTGRDLLRRIRVACSNHLPVHLQQLLP